jgi:hypothetical protein
MQPGRFVVLRRALAGAAWNIRSVIHEPQAKRQRDMKILRHDQDCLEARLTPQDARWRVRAIGTGIVLALAIVAFGYRLLVPETPIPEPLFFASGIILGPLTGFMLKSCFTYETQTLRLDKAQNQFHVTQRHLFDQRALQGALSRIQDVRVTRSGSDDVFIVMLQINGQPAIPLTPTHAVVSYDRLVEFAPLREFLGLPGAPRPI